MSTCIDNFRFTIVALNTGVGAGLVPATHQRATTRVAPTSLGAVFRGEGPEKPRRQGSPFPPGRGSGGWVFRLNLPRSWVKLVESLLSVPQVI